jgi:hypothetical protein
MSPFVKIDQEIHDIELLPIAFDPYKTKAMLEETMNRPSATLRAKSVTPLKRNKNPLLPS